MDQSVTTAQAADETMIKDVFSRLVDAWNRGDGGAYGTLFTDDADYVDVTGTHTRGGAAIGHMHQFLFDGPLKGSKLASGGQGAVSFLTPDVALVVSGGNSQLVDQAIPPDDRRSINTMVLVKHAGEWKIRAFQNNRVMDMKFGPPAARG